MSDLKDYPVRVFALAATNVLAWAAVIFATTVVGCWLGTCLGAMQIVSPLGFVGIPLLLPLAMFAVPQVILGNLVAFCAFAFPLALEVRRPWIAALINLLTWTGVAVWVMKTYHM